MFVVAGVSGHVGSICAKALISQGKSVKVIVRDSQKGAAWAELGAEVAVGSLEDGAFLAGALKGAAGFFTLLPPNFAAPDFYAYQRQTADAIAGAVKANAVPHVVLLSSVGADLETGTGPIRGLHYLENALRGAGTHLTAIRAGYFQENIGSAFGAAVNMGIFPNFTPSADYPVPMIATQDIGQLAAEALAQPAGKSEVVDLHGPAYSVRQLSEKLGVALRKTLQVVDIPQKDWVSTLSEAGMPPHIAEVFAEMYAGFASGAIAPCGDRMVQGKTEIDGVISKLVG